MSAPDSIGLSGIARSNGSAIFGKLAASISWCVWLVAIVELALGLGALAHWMATGDLGLLDLFFRRQGSLFLTGFAAVEYLLSLMVWRLLESGERLRGAWFYIMLAAGCRLVGLFTANVLRGFAYGGLEPAGGAAGGPAVSALLDLGLAISNPVNMVLLAIGLFLVLRLYREVGVLRRLRWPDFLLLVVVGIFIGSHVSDLTRWLVRPQGSVSVVRGVNWITDLLVGLPLVEAVLIRRSVLNMGGGLISRCWGAYTTAIFLASAGSLGIWALNSGLIAWQFYYLISCVWLLAAIAFALGPAYQVEAIVRARATG